jgi:hypothetical protein
MSCWVVVVVIMDVGALIARVVLGTTTRTLAGDTGGAGGLCHSVGSPERARGPIGIRPRRGPRR